MPNRIFLAWVLLVLVPGSLPAQVMAVPPGTRVRLRQHPCADAPRVCMPVVGRALGPAGDSLLVEDDQGVVRTVDLQSGARIERSAGYKRHTLLGLGLGTLAGVGTGAVLASGCTQGGRGEDDGLCNLHYVIAIPAGAAVGTLVGALIRTERWEAVPGSGAALSVWPGAAHTTVVVTGRF